MKTTSRTIANAFTEMFDHPHPEEEFAAEQDEGILMSNLRFAERLFPGCGVGLCPVSHTRTAYLSKNCERILGHPHEELLKMGPAELFALIHPEDLSLAQQCFAYIKNLKPFDPEAYRFILQYRIRDHSGEYFVIRNENLALRATEKTYLYLMLYSRDAEPVRYHRVKLEMLQRKKGSFTKINTYYPRLEDVPMTPRQADIARLIMKGYSNQQIAEHLGISLFTIKNHKKTLFKKVNVRSSAQLASMMMEKS